MRFIFTLSVLIALCACNNVPQQKHRSLEYSNGPVHLKIKNVTWNIIIKKNALTLFDASEGIVKDITIELKNRLQPVYHTSIYKPKIFKKYVAAFLKYKKEKSLTALFDRQKYYYNAAEQLQQTGFIKLESIEYITLAKKKGVKTVVVEQDCFTGRVDKTATYLFLIKNKIVKITAFTKKKHFDSVYKKQFKKLISYIRFKK